MRQRFAAWANCLSALDQNDLCFYFTVGFVFLAAGLVIYHFFIGDKRRIKNDLINVLIVAISTLTSIQALKGEMTFVITKTWSITCPSTLAFPVLVFLKILLGFWIYHMLFCLSNSGKISESGLKIFGIEMTNKMIRTEIGLADLSDWIDQVTRRMNRLAFFNQEYMEFLERRFEHQIAQAKDRPKAIREATESILTAVYFEQESGVDFRILVCPLAGTELPELDQEIANVIRSKDTGESIICGAQKNIALCLYRSGRPATHAVIIIQAPKGYEMSRGEASAAGMIYASLIKTA